MRSRGRSFPRLVNFSRAASARSRTFCSTSRKVRMCSSIASVLPRNSSDCGLTLVSSVCINVSSILAEHFGRYSPVEAIEGLIVFCFGQGPYPGALGRRTVYTQAVAADEGGAGAQQEADCRTDFRFSTHPLDGDIIAKAANPLLHVFGIVIHAAGSDPAWCYRIHPNARGAPFHGGCLGEVHHASPCCT